jgi:iron complex transport system permease protein
MAGPYVLGLSSGSSLGVAFVLLGAGFLPSFFSEFLLSSYGIILASCFGSLFVLLMILVVSQRLRDTDTQRFCRIWFAAEFTHLKTIRCAIVG